MRIVQAEDTRSIEPLLDTIIEGDCIEKIKGIPDESIDMVLCDLPYGTNGTPSSTSMFSSPNTAG